MRTVFRLANRRSFSSSAIRTCKQRRSPTYGVIIRSEYRIKFKAEALQSKTGLTAVACSFRTTWNSQWPQCTDWIASRFVNAGLFPVLGSLKQSAQRVGLVNKDHRRADTAGTAGPGRARPRPKVTGKSNVALWRQRGDRRQLAGEFSFECKPKRTDQRHDRVNTARNSLAALQEMGRDWTSVERPNSHRLSPQRKPASGPRVIPNLGRSLRSIPSSLATVSAHSMVPGRAELLTVVRGFSEWLNRTSVCINYLVNTD